MIRKKYVIVGAGVSGLSFANEINSDDMLIIEKDSSMGGYCKTIKYEGFIWDFSGHFLHFRNNMIKDEVKSLLKGGLKRLKRNSKVFVSDKIVDYPFQHNIHQLGVKDYFQCIFSYIVRKKSLGSFKNYLISSNGEEISKRFLIPYNEKLFACNLEDLDPDAMGRFFPKTTFSSFFSRSKLYNDNIYYPVGGIFDLIKKLLVNIDHENILLGNPLIKVDLKNKIVWTSTTKIKYDYLINTIPFASFFDLIRDQLVEQVDGLSWNRVLVFNFGFDRPSVHKALWYYVPDKDIVFYRVGFYNNIYGSGNMSIYVEIGLKHDSSFDLSELRNKTMSGLKKLKIITNHRLVAESHVLMDPAYVHIKSYQKDAIRRIIRSLEKRGVYSLGRYANWDYLSIEDCISQAKELKKA